MEVPPPPERVLNDDQDDDYEDLDAEDGNALFFEVDNFLEKEVADGIDERLGDLDVVEEVELEEVDVEQLDDVEVLVGADDTGGELVGVVLEEGLPKDKGDSLDEDVVVGHLEDVEHLDLVAFLDLRESQPQLDQQVVHVHLVNCQVVQVPLLVEVVIERHVQLDALLDLALQNQLDVELVQLRR